ncbi:SpoIID/LytB domain-containing protein [Phormidium sp. CLA17]|uniref:SpoIID/LytB domain-containing protein n=1 Tax=Leptolyngbya sp. Cla-17 TaxID=2803751 RepID=UPI001492CB1B|nr:SpoIID/LytB domain-containing protein [Leptolyngbya sp. Cla-17]MBM0740452.1 SpoIID/LytB domain-containing protein [Leptolyngbya sp. Cla-17]
MQLKGFPQTLLFYKNSLIQFGKQTWWFSIACCVAIAAPAQASVEMRVGIEEAVPQVTVGSSTRALVRDSAGRDLGEIAAMNAFIAQSENGKVKVDRWKSTQIWIEPTGGGYVFIGDRWYRGKTCVIPTAKGLTAVNYVDLEQYLYSVLGGEIFPSWPIESLKAQAVVARSYALYQRQTKANSLYDVGDTVRSQVYKGILDETGSTQTAVNATAGEVLTHQGRIIEAVFHSASGGHTENVENVWTRPLPYLKAVPDYDQGSPEYEWVKTFSRSELSARITGVGNIISMEPEKTTPYGRVRTMRIVGDAGTRTMTGDALRNALQLKSTKFTVLSDGAVAGTKSKEQANSTFKIKGGGYGHGLGMSQWGAHNLAQRGVGYQQIVLHYYKNTILAKLQK